MAKAEIERLKAKAEVQKRREAEIEATLKKEKAELEATLEKQSTKLEVKVQVEFEVALNEGVVEATRQYKEKVDKVNL